ncbi:hypothetical protein E4O93_17455 [Diaphorobacter sp. DS2]|nr:hypothetical protein E4O93_17455 [Diaphorobacter sp. DS2]
MAETSAIGRALGFLGYGLIGTGIASAEEMDGAEGEEEDQSPEKLLVITITIRVVIIILHLFFGSRSLICRNSTEMAAAYSML